MYVWVSFHSLLFCAEKNVRIHTAMRLKFCAKHYFSVFILFFLCLLSVYKAENSLPHFYIMKWNSFIIIIFVLLWNKSKQNTCTRSSFCLSKYFSSFFLFKKIIFVQICRKKREPWPQLSPYSLCMHASCFIIIFFIIIIFIISSIRIIITIIIIIMNVFFL